MTQPTDRELIQYLVNELQGYRVAHPDHEMPALEAGRTRLAQPEPKDPTLMEIVALADEVEEEGLGQVALVRRALARWGRPTIKPVPVAERFEFSVFDSEYEEQAAGTAPTYSQALSEGQHYLAMYSQDGPHSLELRRIEILPCDALPVLTTH